MNMNHKNGWFEIIFEIIIVVIMIVLMHSCVNSNGETIWNNGICPDCDVRYELRGVSRGLKYYVCPECGKEVERY